MASAGATMPTCLVRLLATRRLRQSRAIPAMVSLGVTFAVASSFFTVAAMLASVRRLTSRVDPNDSLGLELIRDVVRRGYVPYVGIAALVLCIAAAGISCVLAVAFMGRKRSLGILKVLGVTNPDLGRAFALETLLLGGLGIPAGILLGLALTSIVLGSHAAVLSCYLVSASFGLAALALGALLPLRLLWNGSCEQLLNNRPVYASRNLSCAKCGLCGGF